ncbi:hypothetical protein MSPP1_000265 [Malassezia sp. CBS 17886]|nr:hypothetical protein MSPP1_000265 [Malassezia sp. CBS 17886]
MVSLTNPHGMSQEQKDAAAPQAALAADLASQGANVQVMDEDASPEEKAQQAEKARADLQPRGELAQKQTEAAKEREAELNRAIASDYGGTRVRANVNLRDLDAASRAAGQLGFGELVPGSLPAGSESVDIPDWFTVGWIGASRALRGLTPGELEETQSRARDNDLVTTFLSDAYYGYFWSDASVIVTAVVVTYYATRFGGGWAMLVIILSICGTYYCTSARRTRERTRDDVARELARQRMMTENETARWINHFLARFWLIYEPVLSATIIQSVDAVLKDQCPPFLDSLRLTTFTLGTKAPIIDSVRTLSDTPDDVIVMDWKISFTPNDVQDLTVRKAARKINPKVVLTVRVGKGFVGAGMPILLENMSFVGSLRIRLKLISSFPHVQVVDITFMEPPQLDYELKPIGGSSLGFDVAALPGLSGFIKNQINANLGPMMYYPNQFSLNLEELMSGTPLDAAVGVLQVSIWSARDLKQVKFAGGVPGPYVTVAINDERTIEKTRTKENTYQPTFKETKYLVLSKLEGLLRLTTFDFNTNRPDTRLGVTTFNLESLAEEPSPGQLNKAIMHDGRPSGSIQFSLTFLPVMQPEVAPDGTALPLPETTAGILRLTLHQAKDLAKKSHVPGDMQPMARILVNDKPTGETPEIKNTSDPIFEDATEFFVTDRYSSVITVEIIDNRELAGKPVVGRVNVKVDDLVQAHKREQDWFPIPGEPHARVRMSAQWRPIVMPGSINGSNSYRPAIGAMKVWVRGGRDLKNVEALSGGKSDPYAMLRVNNLIVSGTAVFDNELNPTWNQILYAPVHSTSEIVRLEVMDYQTYTPDRTLGFCDIHVDKFSESSIDTPPYPYRSLGRKTFAEQLKQPNGSHKGTVGFDAEFIPAVAVEGSTFIEQNKRIASERKAQAAAAGDSTQVGSVHDSPDAPEDATPVAGDSVGGEDDDDDAMRAHLSPAELLQQHSGIVAFNLIQGEIPKPRSQLEIVFDDSYWPAYTTERRKQKYTWDEVGEAVIRELDVSNVWLRLRNGPADENVYAEYRCSTRELLEKTLTQPDTFSLTYIGKDGIEMPSLEMPDVRMPDMSMPDMKTVTNLPGNVVGMGVGAVGKGIDAVGKGVDSAGSFAANGDIRGAVAPKPTVTLSCRYIPMDVHLEPVESVVNEGLLQVYLVSAAHLRSADRGGKSDPYVFFQENGETLARSKTVKRTLDPVFNEDLGALVVRSRLTNEYTFKLRDWDQVGASDPLGEAHANLAELEPYEEYEKTYRVVGEGSTDNSTITVRLSFHPMYVNNRTTKDTRTAAGVIGGIGGIGKGVASGGLHVGRGIISAITGPFHHHHDHDDAAGAEAAGAGRQGAGDRPMSSLPNDAHSARAPTVSSRYAESIPGVDNSSQSVRHRRRLYNPFKRSKEPAA